MLHSMEFKAMGSYPAQDFGQYPIDNTYPYNPVNYNRYGYQEEYRSSPYYSDVRPKHVSPETPPPKPRPNEIPRSRLEKQRPFESNSRPDLVKDTASYQRLAELRTQGEKWGGSHRAVGGFAQKPGTSVYQRSVPEVGRVGNYGRSTYTKPQVRSSIPADNSYNTHKSFQSALERLNPPAAKPQRLRKVEIMSTKNPDIIPSVYKTIRFTSKPDSTPIPPAIKDDLSDLTDYFSNAVQDLFGSCYENTSPNEGIEPTTFPATSTPKAIPKSKGNGFKNMCESYYDNNGDISFTKGCYNNASVYGKFPAKSATATQTSPKSVRDQFIQTPTYVAACRNASTETCVTQCDQSEAATNTSLIIERTVPRRRSWPCLCPDVKMGRSKSRSRSFERSVIGPLPPPGFRCSERSSSDSLDEKRGETWSSFLRGRDSGEQVKVETSGSQLSSDSDTVYGVGVKMHRVGAADSTSLSGFSPSINIPPPPARSFSYMSALVEAVIASTCPDSAEAEPSDDIEVSEFNSKLVWACEVYSEYLGNTEAVPMAQMEEAVQLLRQFWFDAGAAPSDLRVSGVRRYLQLFKKFGQNFLSRAVNMYDNSGNTVLHYAVSASSMLVVDELLKTGLCDCNTINKAGYSPIMLAALMPINNPDERRVICKLFQEADLNGKCYKSGQTALMLAASHGRVDTLSVLLDIGADPNLQDHDGSTALMCAAEHGHDGVAKKLLGNPDTDSLLTDHEGSTALTVAMENKHKDIAVLIYSHQSALESRLFGKLEQFSELSKTRRLSEPELTLERKKMTTFAQIKENDFEKDTSVSGCIEDVVDEQLEGSLSTREEGTSSEESVRVARKTKVVWDKLPLRRSNPSRHSDGDWRSDWESESINNGSDQHTEELRRLGQVYPSMSGRPRILKRRNKRRVGAALSRGASFPEY